MRWPDFKNIRMPDFSGAQMPEMGDYTSSLVITIGILLIGFLLFRKLIKLAALVGLIFLLMYFIT